MWPILKSRHFGIEPATPTVRPLRRRSVWFCLALLVPGAGASIVPAMVAKASRCGGSDGPDFIRETPPAY
jgi:hypothetical protein